MVICQNIIKDKPNKRDEVKQDRTSLTYTFGHTCQPRYKGGCSKQASRTNREKNLNKQVRKQRSLDKHSLIKAR